MAIPISSPAPGTVETRRDMLVTSGWSFVWEGQVIQDVIEVSGIQRSIETSEWVDAGTNVKHYFSNQIKEYIADGKIVYRIDPTSTEYDLITNLVTGSLLFGLHYNFTLIKRNHGVEVFRINVYEAIFKSEAHPSYTKNESAPYDVEISFSAAYYEIVKI